MNFVLQISNKKKNFPNKIIVHTAASSIYSSWKDVDEYHKLSGEHTISDMGYYCAYHFYIDYYGAVQQCRAIYELGEHAIGQNDTSIGICLAGNGDKNLPSEAQNRALQRLLDQLCTEIGIDPESIYPHRQFTKLKSCYGHLLSDSWARDLLKEYRLKKYDYLQKQYFKLRRLLFYYLRKYGR